MPRLLRRTALMVGVGVAVLAVSAPPAAAHVTVHSDEAVQGAFAEIAFRVPTESATASTVKLRVAFPTGQPIDSVSVRPHPGWTYKISTVPVQQAAAAATHDHGGPHQTVSEIEWTATPGSAIKPGEYDEFRIEAGPLPATANLVFKAVQTYDTGEEIRWIDLPAAQEPEHPAPALAIAAPDQVARTPTTTPGATTPMVWWAVGVAGVALLLALGSLGFALQRRK
jgi:uncharacterized protein YcnI